MKKLYVLTISAVMLVACGEKKDEKKSICDCMKEAMKGDVEEAPAGCEWMDKLTEAELEKEMMSAMKDCPDMIGYFMLGEDNVELEDMNVELEDMPAQAIENSSTSNASIALDDYEAYVNEYLEIVSNIKNGNAEEWKRYEEFSGQADQLGITLSELSTEFTEEQAERYQELNQKITDAAMSLYK